MIKILFFNEKAQQLKELEASFVAATKEMQSAQAKMAVETAKEVSPPLYRVVFFNCSAQISVLKRKTLCNQ